MPFDAGSAYVSVLPNASGFLASMQRQISPALAKIQAQGISSGAAIGTAFAVAGVLAFKGLQSAVNATEEWASAVRGVQRVTGLAAEEASGLTFAARSLGIETDKLTVGLGLLAKNIVNNTTNFAKYGIATRDAQGNQLGLIDILGNVADKYDQLGGGLQGAALAMNVFGRSGKNLIPILKLGSEGLQEMFTQAQSFGLVLSQDALDASKAFGIAQRQLALSFEGFKVQVGEALIPVLTTFVGVLTDLVGILHLIPGPVVDAAAGFLVLSGALVAIRAIAGVIAAAWAPLVGLFTGAAGAATAEAAATAAQIDANAILLAQLPALIEALQVLAGIEVEVAGAAGTAATALGAEAAVAGAAVGEISAAGAAAGTAGVAGLASLAATAGIAAIGIIGVGVALAKLTGHDERTFKVLGDDLAGLVDQAGAALAQLQADMGKTSLQLGTSIAASVRALAELGDQAVAGSDVIGKLSIEIGRAGTGLARFAQLTGVDATAVLGTFQQAVADAAGSLPKLQTAASTALAQAKATWGQWHDTVVQAFGGAGSALDAFADKSNVDLGRATNQLTQYTRQIESFGGNIKTISDEFGKKAEAFIQWATSQGLAQAGLVATVADASKQNAQAFVDAFNTGGRATSDLADQIQQTLGKAFDAMIAKLGAIKRALLGQPPLKLKVEDKQAQQAAHKLERQVSKLVTPQQRIEIGVTDETGKPIQTIGDKVAELTRNPFTVTMKGDTSSATNTFQSFLSAWAGKTVTLFGLLKVSTSTIPAATGFHAQVSRPTLFLAGEAGSERVDITPGGGGRTGGSGQLRGQLQMVDWHRGLVDLQAELDHQDFVGAR